MPDIASRLRHALSRLRGEPVERDLRPYEKQLRKMDALRDRCASLPDDCLSAWAGELRTRARNSVTGDDLTVEAFALVREAADRLLGLRLYDEQILGGLALANGRVVEMATGEGKTLAAVAPTLLRALDGRGVHILTFNDYLAQRDAQWMGPVYSFLGLTVCDVREGMDFEARQRAYAADVTYVTAREAGFDFLRDRLARRAADVRQRKFNFAIVDEADSLMIDEARVPLVIAGSAGHGPFEPRRLADLVARLRCGADFETDEHERNVFLTEAGVARCEAELSCPNLHAAANHHVLTSLNLALHAHAMLRRDVDYIVRGGRIELVDEFTGRVAENRRWPDGLQTALEAKEKLELQREGAVLGSITLQHFFNLYPRVSGMTATAVAAAEEFAEFFGLHTVVIPPHRACARIDRDDVVFVSRAAKEAAIVAEISRCRDLGRPVLVGTASVEESERLAAGLGSGGIACAVLNAKNDEEEAAIVARAGHSGAVTISTNMAGRGTDIRLGADDADRERVIAAGGLYVIGTNRHESRRIDDQLRGRAGRQGDPGESRFVVSLEDDLVERYGLRELLTPPQDHDPAAPLTEANLSGEIARAQRIIEGENLSIRKTLWGYSQIVEDERRQVQRRRDDLLAAGGETWLAEADRPTWNALAAAFGEDAVIEAERQFALDAIDRAWAEHLANVADIRESAYLAAFGDTSVFGMARSPIHQFIRQVDAGFTAAFAIVIDEVVGQLREIAATDADLKTATAARTAPAATWTYLINDNPFGNAFERFFRGVKEKLLGGKTRAEANRLDPSKKRTLIGH